MDKFTEAQLVCQLSRTLKTEGYAIWHEVPNYSQSIDILAEKDSSLMAIEVKKSNWRRAIAQCSAHESVADFVCLAVATLSVSVALLNEAEKRGYGVLHFERSRQEFVWALEPERNNLTWEPMKRALRTNIGRLEEV